MQSADFVYRKNYLIATNPYNTLSSDSSYVLLCKFAVFEGKFLQYLKMHPDLYMSTLQYLTLVQTLKHPANS